MPNPIRRIRAELGLTRRQLCHAAGLRLDGLYLAENGLIARPQGKLLRFLAEVGYDGEQILTQYGDYRAQLKADVLAALRGGRPVNEAE